MFDRISGLLGIEFQRPGEVGGRAVDLAGLQQALRRGRCRRRPVLVEFRWRWV